MDINAFLEKIVFGWIKNDLERMTKEIPARNGAVGNINFPLSLCVLAYMEYLGGFLLGRKGDFTHNVEEYLERCFQKSEEYPIDILRDIFRNGLAHEYFARGAISRNGLRPPVYKHKEAGAILDVETLIEDFLSSLEKFKMELSKENFDERMRLAKDEIERMRDKHKQIIDSLSEGQVSQKPNLIFNASAGPISGFSGLSQDH